MGQAKIRQTMDAFRAENGIRFVPRQRVRIIKDDLTGHAGKEAVVVYLKPDVCKRFIRIKFLVGGSYAEMDFKDEELEPINEAPAVAEKPIENDTPAAQWRVEGKNDPFDKQYNCRRKDLMGGDKTDDEVAHACGMADGRTIQDSAVLLVAKERIRWLSRQLIAAEEKLKASEN